MTGNTKLILVVVASVIAIIGGAIFLSAGGKPSVERAKMGTASLVMDKTRVDLGAMKADDERAGVFVIQNTSGKTLRIWNVTTSCSCTFATIKIGDKSTGEFNMHESTAMKNWVGEIPAGEKAELTAIYRPRIMPVVGKVNRQIVFSTNDPASQQVELTIEAEVL